MKFLVSYECRDQDGQFFGQFEFEADREPTQEDKAVLEAALKDSSKFHRSGMGGLSINSVLSTS